MLNDDPVNNSTMKSLEFSPMATLGFLVSFSNQFPFLFTILTAEGALNQLKPYSLEANILGYFWVYIALLDL